MRYRNTKLPLISILSTRKPGLTESASTAFNEFTEIGEKKGLN